MTSYTRARSVPVADGEVPIHVAGPDGEEAASLAGLVVIPSIFGPAEELLGQIESLSDVALTAVMDPFWRVEAGAIPYANRDAAFERVGRMDRTAAGPDVEAVAAWLAERTNGNVVGLGICFGGPFVLLGAANGHFAGGVTWHGSRMEGVLDRVTAGGPVTVPLRLHFGDADTITPPDVIDTISETFADHPDCSIVVHPGLAHGFTHEGAAFDADATAAGLAAVRELLEPH